MCVCLSFPSEDCKRCPELLINLLGVPNFLTYIGVTTNIVIHTFNKIIRLKLLVVGVFGSMIYFSPKNFTYFLRTYSTFIMYTEAALKKLLVADLRAIIDDKLNASSKGMTKSKLVILIMELQAASTETATVTATVSGSETVTESSNPSIGSLVGSLVGSFFCNPAPSPSPTPQDNSQPVDFLSSLTEHVLEHVLTYAVEQFPGLENSPSVAGANCCWRDIYAVYLISRVSKRFHWFLLKSSHSHIFLSRVTFQTRPTQTDTRVSSMLTAMNCRELTTSMCLPVKNGDRITGSFLSALSNSTKIHTVDLRPSDSSLGVPPLDVELILTFLSTVPNIENVPLQQQTNEGSKKVLHFDDDFCRVLERLYEIRTARRVNQLKLPCCEKTLIGCSTEDEWMARAGACLSCGAFDCPDQCAMVMSCDTCADLLCLDCSFAMKDSVIDACHFCYKNSCHKCDYYGYCEHEDCKNWSCDDCREVIICVGDCECSISKCVEHLPGCRRCSECYNGYCGACVPKYMEEGLALIGWHELVCKKCMGK